jgi:ADP-ribose pyrophosphatase
MSVELIASGRFLRLVKDGKWEYAERVRASGVIAILPITRDDKVILVEQFRPPISSRAIELPAGLAGDIVGEESESLETAARRELLEESGYANGRWKLLGIGPSSAGLTNEVITFFAAEDVEQVAEGGGDGTEDILVHVVPLNELRKWLAEKVAAGLMVDHKIYACLAMVGRIF